MPQVFLFMMMAIYFYNLYIAQIIPIHTNVPDFQTDFYQLSSTNCNIILDGGKSKGCQINFTSSFGEIPQVQFYVTGFNVQRSDKFIQNTTYNYFIIDEVIDDHNNPALYHTIQWIATTNTKIQFILQPVNGSSNYTIDYSNSQFSIIPDVQVIFKSNNSIDCFSMNYTKTISNLTIQSGNQSVQMLFLIIIIDLNGQENNKLSLETQNNALVTTGGPIVQNYTINLAFKYPTQDSQPQIMIGFNAIYVEQHPFKGSLRLTQNQSTLQIYISVPGSFNITYSSLTLISCLNNSQYDRSQDTCYCNSYDHRNLSSLNTCDCSIGYFNNSQNQCQTCHINCLTCSNATQSDCLTCDSNPDRRQLTNQECSCMGGYFEVLGNKVCEPCYMNCGTCYGELQNDCISCKEGLNRILDQNQCNCEMNYYYSDDQICEQCHYSCMACSGPLNTSCLSCDPDSKRNKLNVQQNMNCLCPLFYFDDGRSQQCQPCHYSCLTCNGTNSNNCSTCSNNSSREIINGTTCQCQVNYYDPGSVNCSKCHYSCSHCDDSTNQSCLSCGDEAFNHRQLLINSECICLVIGYFDSLNDQICQNCDSRCQKCYAQNEYDCTSCYVDQHRKISSNTCLCEYNYYQFQKSSTCSYCLQQCIKCPRASPQTPIINQDCTCDANCVSIINSQKSTIAKQNQAYSVATGSSSFTSYLIKFAQPLGVLSGALNSPQMVLTTFLLEYDHPESIQQLDRYWNVNIKNRVLSIFVFSAQITANQTNQKDTILTQFHYENFTDQAFEQSDQSRFRLIGISYLVIYTITPQIIMIGLMFVIYSLISMRKRRMQNKSFFLKTQRVINSLTHIIVEGSFLFLFTSAFLSLKYLPKLNTKECDAYLVISSIMSITFLSSQLIYFLYILNEILSFMKKKLKPDKQIGDLVEVYLLEEIILHKHPFYVTNNPLKTLPQSLYTLMCQVKKGLFALIIVACEGSVRIQYFCFITLSGIFLLYSLIAHPFKSKIVYMMDVVLQSTFTVYLVFCFLDYEKAEEVQLGYLSVSGVEAYYLTLVILLMDLLKQLVKVSLAFQNYWQHRKDIKGEQYRNLQGEIVNFNEYIHTNIINNKSNQVDDAEILSYEFVNPFQIEHQQQYQPQEQNPIEPYTVKLYPNLIDEKGHPVNKATVIKQSENHFNKSCMELSIITSNNK